MAIQRLIACAAILAFSTSVLAQTTYQGCKQIDFDASPDNSNTELDDPYPDACKDYCNELSYSYYAISSASCSCWLDPPTIDQSYPEDDTDHDKCYFNCGTGHETEYCGGYDLDNVVQLYSYYVSPVAAAPVVDPGTTSTTATTTATTSATSVTTATTTDPASTTTASTTTVAASESSTSISVASALTTTVAPAVAAAAVAAADSASYPDYTRTVYATSTNWHTVCPKCSPEPTQVVYAVSTICYEAKLYTQSSCYSTLKATCSNGNLETSVVGPTPCVVPYDPALSTASVVTDGTVTETLLVARPTIANAAVVPAPFTNGTANGTVVAKPFVQIAGAERVAKSGGALALIVGVVVALL